MSFFLSPKEKKKKQAQKNKYHQMIYEFVRLRREEVIRVNELENKQKIRPRDSKSEDDLVWSAKVGEVRNRLTGRKHAAKERWNRFAGTGDEGSRGL